MYIYLSLGDIGTLGPPGPPGPSSTSSMGLNPTSLMSLFMTSTHLAQLSNNDQNSLETATKFLDDLKHVSNRIILKIKPDGSRMYPARSCRDIADYYPEKSNGSIKFIFIFSILQIFIFS
jgi:hypothetical protein